MFDIQYIQLYNYILDLRLQNRVHAIHQFIDNPCKSNHNFSVLEYGRFFIYWKGWTSKLSKRFCFQPYCSWILFHFRITICMCCKCTFLRLFLYGCLRHQYYIIPSPTFSTYKIFIISLQFYKRTYDKVFSVSWKNLWKHNLHKTIHLPLFWFL